MDDIKVYAITVERSGNRVEVRCTGPSGVTLTEVCQDIVEKDRPYILASRAPHEVYEEETIDRMIKGLIDKVRVDEYKWEQIGRKVGVAV